MPSPLLLAAFLALPARASQFAVPLHVPPRLRPEPGKLSFQLGMGWGAARVRGLAADGLGGSWELASASRGTITGHLHSEAFVLSGRGEPLGSGRRHASGMTGTFEGDVDWAPWGQDAPVRFYGGGAASLSSLSFLGAGSITFAGGQIRVEPDTATSIVVGFPLGMTARTGERWVFDAGAFVVPWIGGATFFSYGPAGPFGRGRSDTVDPHLTGGGRLRLEYSPWRLSGEAGASVGTTSGNNDGMTTGYALLAFRFM